MSDTGRALALAYRFIDRRERTTAEVRMRLEREELPADEVDSALAELTELGYLDDARFARVFAEDKRNLGDWGSERIERALLERGIDPRLVAAVGSGSATDDEHERALALARRRFPAPSDDPREHQRVLGMLIRKGYDSDLAYDVVRAWSRVV